MIKKGDKVIVIAGKDKKKSGEVLKVYPKTGLAIVAGVNVIKKHKKPTRGGAKGSILEIEAPINISNVRLENK